MAENLEVLRPYVSSQLPMVISDLAGRVIHINDAAKKYIRHPDREMVRELFDFGLEDLKWYNSIEPKKQSYGIRICHMEENETEYLLDSKFQRIQNELFRVDTFGTEKDHTLSDYYIHFEDFMEHVNALNRTDLTEEQQIIEILKYAQYIYAADRVFVVEVDKSIGCLSDLYVCVREDFTDCIEPTRTIGVDGADGMIEYWNHGINTYNSAFVKSEQDAEMQGQLYKTLDAWPTMMIPFPKSCGIRCFLCVDNVRRFFGNISVLENMTILIANKMYMMQLKESVEASRRLNLYLRKVPENMVRVQFLGGLRVQTHLGILEDENFTSTQCETFFVYLLCNRNRVVSVRELAEIIWPDKLIDAPYDMIKGVAFRTKKIFENISPMPIIQAGNGTYSINKNIDIWLDVEEFDYQCKKALDTTLDIPSRKEAFSAALALYTGPMLPNLDAETWLIARSSYYQLRCEELIQSYIQMLDAENDYVTMMDLATKATELQVAFGEIHAVLIRALLRNGKVNIAKNYFSKALGELSDEEKQEIQALLKKKN